MPLSEYEQRVLEQMERQLTSDDPRLASTMQSSRRPSGGLRLVLALVGVVLGLLLLVVGVASSVPWLGVVGFVIMFAAVTTAFSSPRTRTKGPLGTVGSDGTVTPGGRKGHGRAGKGSAARGSRGAASADGRTFMERLGDRWDRRRDEGGR